MLKERTAGTSTSTTRRTSQSACALCSLAPAFLDLGLSALAGIAELGPDSASAHRLMRLKARVGKRAQANEVAGSPASEPAYDRP